MISRGDRSYLIRLILKAKFGDDAYRHVTCISFMSPGILLISLMRPFWVNSWQLKVVNNSRKIFNHDCVKSVHITSFFCSVFSRIRTNPQYLFGLNTGKYGPEKNSVFGHFLQSAQTFYRILHTPPETVGQH